MDFREYLIKELTELKDISAPFIEKRFVDHNEKSDNDSSELQITKEKVIEYLLDHGYEINQENYEQARTKLAKGNFSKHIKEEYVNHLNDLTEPQLALLIELAKLKVSYNTAPQLNYEYKVEFVDENYLTGSAIIELSNLINEYAKNNYRLAHCAVSQIGQRSTTMLSQYESKTIERYILIFEKIK